MKRAAGIQERVPPYVRVAAAVAAFLAMGWLVAPHFAQLAHSALGLAAGMAIAGFLLRRNAWDAAVLGLPVLAGNAGEIELGPVMMSVAVAGLFAASRRPRFAAAIGAALFTLLLVAIRLKERFAGTPLNWYDVHFFLMRFGDNVGVLASQPTLLAYAAGVVAALGGLGWITWRFDRGSVAAAPATGQAAAASAGLVVLAWGVFLVHGQIAALGRESAWTLGVLGDYDRPLSGFLATAGREPRWTPPPADTGAFGERVHQRMATAAAAPRADIVLFLQESQFNPATIEGCPPDLCDLPVFRSAPGLFSGGPLQVYRFGGGTWLTEFALETGVPHTAFGPGGDFAPFTVAPGVRRSFVRSLKAAGYRTIALYPTGGGMMNARTAYAGYGFDRFLDADDLGLSGSYATSDEAIHAAARRVLEQERGRDKPVFLMVLTIFNHAEHGARMDRVPPALVERASEYFKGDKLAANVADYVWRTGEFARALPATRAAVLDAGRPAVLAWFGDHQPPFGNALELRDRIRAFPTAKGTMPAKYQTWYQVSSNVRSPGKPPAPQALDIVFLPGLLAQAAGVPLDEWLAANVTAREECGGLLQQCARSGTGEAYLSYLWKDLGEFSLP